MNKSFLWKSNIKNSVFNNMDYSTISVDLGLNKILGIMSNEPKINITKEIFLASVSFSKDDILYRQGILEELEKQENAMQLLEGILSNLNDMKFLHKSLKPDMNIPFIMLRIKKLNLYCSVMDSLRQLFCSDDHGELSDIAMEIEEEYIKSGVSELKESLNKSKKLLLPFQSMDLGVNLDEKGLAREAIILKYNDYVYGKNNLIDKLSAESYDERSRISIAPVQDIYEKGQYIMFTNRIFKEFDSMLNKEVHSLDGILEKHSDVITSSIIFLRDELLIYYGALRLKKYLNENNLTVILPSVGYDDIKICGLYSFNMALESTLGSDIQIKVVKNDFEVNNDRNLMVVTGPNDGGKTVFLEALTISQIFAQNGIYFPAQSAELKIYKKIFTHFPKDEDINFGTGRLGEEAKRFSEIISSIEIPTLLSANEPYVTTSPDEGLRILAHTIEKLWTTGTDVFLVTHYLDILKELGKSCKEKAYTAELENGVRTYKMLPNKPMAISHAMDIARKHGIDKESIIKMIYDRKQL